jgi:hypothetical protein
MVAEEVGLRALEDVVFVPARLAPRLAELVDDGAD